MTHFLRRSWLVCFLIGFFGAILAAAIATPPVAASPTEAHPRVLTSAFEQVAASHLEPNFYQ